VPVDEKSSPVSPTLPTTKFVERLQQCRGISAAAGRPRARPAGTLYRSPERLPSRPSSSRGGRVPISRRAFDASDHQHINGGPL
jgi:hypothetical protein